MLDSYITIIWRENERTASNLKKNHATVSIESKYGIIKKNYNYLSRM